MISSKLKIKYYENQDMTVMVLSPSNKKKKNVVDIVQISYVG